MLDVNLLVDSCKSVPFEWDEAGQKASERIKKYQLKPPILGTPIEGKQLILCISERGRSLGSPLAQANKNGKERKLYYLSQTLLGVELKYAPIKKMCLALIFSVQELRHYMLAYIVHLIAGADPSSILCH